MGAHDLQPGALVSLSGALSVLGIGKVASRSGDSVTVEYFHTIVRRCEETVLASQVNRVRRLASQTRCYVFTKDAGWRMGRIGRRVDDEYEVLFRHGDVRFLPEAAVYVRCLAAIEDPLETLAHKAHETPFFHDRRFRFMRSLVRQRAAARGMTGLLSARINLYPHQVEVVRRVLEDPIQRYLLADEVGLGKTIEAGVILRQYLLDSPYGRALVLVPPLLVDQWNEELESRIQISRIGRERILVAPTDDVESAEGSGPFGMVVIDEAQHIALDALSPHEAERRRYESYARLCHSIERVLLLSATPVLNNERDFLAMLHLLDPEVYRLDNLDAFRARVQNRQEIGHVLLSLQEGSPAYLILPSIERLRALFPTDPRLEQLMRELEGAVAGGQLGDTARDRAIRAIRVHVSETYRLHRRMLRNRRSALEGATLLGRVSSDGSQTPRILENDLDERSPHLHALLEDWRDAAVASLGTNQAFSESSFVRVFSLLFQGLGSWLELLREAVLTRLGRGDGASLRPDVSDEDVRLLHETPLFPGESQILEVVLAVLAETSEEGDRIELLAQSLALAQRSNRGGPPPKCVVFTSYTRACHEILRRLRAAFGERAVMGYHSRLRRNEVEQGITRFRTHPDCFVLVCDRSGEEGRNLQFAERVIHFDLPLSPNRMEQRIGRLDRIGRDRQVRSTVFIGPECENSIFAAWYDVLNDGFRVFDRSIASLQFHIEESLPRLLGRMFREGAEGLLGEIPTVQAGCAAEQDRIDEQDALDAIDAFEQNAAACFEDIQRLEATHAELETDMHAWVGEALMFRRDPDLYRNERTTRYVPEFDRDGELRTLVPTDWLVDRLAPHLEQPGAFDRRVALRAPGTSVFRIGEGFVDAMAKYLRWDDRGQAFALWRQESGWDPSHGAEWVGFRFNYIVSAELRDAQRLLAEHGLPASAVRSLERRADALFPPLAEVVFLDTDRLSVTDPALLHILTRPYLAWDHGGTDYNLANERLGVVDEIIPPSRWEEVCTEARAASTEQVMGRGMPPLKERCEEFARQAESALASRLTQLSLRASLGGADMCDLGTEQAIGDALIHGIRAPNLRLDSVGFLVVSGRPPRSNDWGE